MYIHIYNHAYTYMEVHRERAHKGKRTKSKMRIIQIGMRDWALHVFVGICAVEAYWVYLKVDHEELRGPLRCSSALVIHCRSNGLFDERAFEAIFPAHTELRGSGIPTVWHRCYLWHARLRNARDVIRASATILRASWCDAQANHAMLHI